MELAFLTPLLKDGANCVNRGVAINNEGLFKMRLSEYWGCADSIHQGLKSGFVFRVPMETTSLGTMCNEGVKWCSEHTKVQNVHAVEVEETEERLKFAKCCGSFPVFNTVDLDWVHGNTIFTNDHTKCYDFSPPSPPYAHYRLSSFAPFMLSASPAMSPSFSLSYCSSSPLADMASPSLSRTLTHHAYLLISDALYNTLTRCGRPFPGLSCI